MKDFTRVQVKSVKIIKSKDEKPKGFGYIEFEDVVGLKDALLKTGSVRPPFLIWQVHWHFVWKNFSGRTIRVSVAEPRKTTFRFFIDLL